MTASARAWPIAVRHAEWQHGLRLAIAVLAAFVGRTADHEDRA